MAQTDTEINTLSKKKRKILVVVLAVSALVLFSFLLLVIRDKNQLIASNYNQLTTMQKDLTDAQNKAAEEQAKLQAIAFAVHPETDYETFRKEAYVELFKQTFPDVTVDTNAMILVRVFNTTSFRNADSLFATIQNDDILVFDERLAYKSAEVPVMVVRPREQKVLVSQPVSTKSIVAARSGNKSAASPLHGPTLNYFSQQ